MFEFTYECLVWCMVKLLTKKQYTRVFHVKELIFPRIRIRPTNSNQPKEIVSRWNPIKLILVLSSRTWCNMYTVGPVSRGSLEVPNLDKFKHWGQHGTGEFSFQASRLKTVTSLASKRYLHVMDSHVSGEWMMGNWRLLWACPVANLYKISLSLRPECRVISYSLCRRLKGSFSRTPREFAHNLSNRYNGVRSGVRKDITYLTG